MKLRAALQRIHWWFLRKVNPVYDVGPLTVVVIHSAEEPAAKAIKSLEEALNILRQAGNGFLALIKEFLVHVGLMEGFASRAGPAPLIRGGILNLSDKQFDNPRLVACHLLWLATYNKNMLMIHNGEQSLSRKEVLERCYESEVRLAKSFEDWPDWMEFLQYHLPN